MSTKPKTTRRAAARKATARKPTAAKKPSTSAQSKPSRKPAAELGPAASKQSQLITLLQSASGATIEQMMSTTGWQAHSVRGTISGVLRKRLGLTVQSATTDGGGRVYRIVSAS